MIQISLNFIDLLPLHILIPLSSPIIFGSLVDSTCLLWKETCSGVEGRCLIYDIDMFRIKYVGIGAAIKVKGRFEEKIPRLWDSV